MDGYQEIDDDLHNWLKMKMIINNWCESSAIEMFTSEFWTVRSTTIQSFLTFHSKYSTSLRWLPYISPTIIIIIKWIAMGWMGRRKKFKSILRASSVVAETAETQHWDQPFRTTSQIHQLGTSQNQLIWQHFTHLAPLFPPFLPWLCSVENQTYFNTFDNILRPPLTDILPNASSSPNVC